MYLLASYFIDENFYSKNFGSHRPIHSLCEPAYKNDSHLFRRHQKTKVIICLEVSRRHEKTENYSLITLKK